MLGFNRFHWNVNLLGVVAALLLPGHARAGLIELSLTATTTFSDAQLGAASAPGAPPTFSGGFLVSPGNGLFTLGAQASGTATASCSSALATCSALSGAVGGSFGSGSFDIGSSPGSLPLTSSLTDLGGEVDASVDRTGFAADFSESGTPATTGVNMNQSFTGVLPPGTEAAASVVLGGFSFNTVGGTGSGFGGIGWFAVANLGSGPVFYGSSGVVVTFTTNPDGSVDFSASLPFTLTPNGTPIIGINYAGGITEVVDPGASITGSAMTAAPEPGTAGPVLATLAGLMLVVRRNRKGRA